jgi:hypothetical protein
VTTEQRCHAEYLPAFDHTTDGALEGHPPRQEFGDDTTGTSSPQASTSGM